MKSSTPVNPPLVTTGPPSLAAPLRLPPSKTLLPLLNVAVTRAADGLFVAGNREPWHKAGVFRTLDERLPR